MRDERNRRQMGRLISNVLDVRRWGWVLLWDGLLRAMCATADVPRRNPDSLSGECHQGNTSRNAERNEEWKAKTDDTEKKTVSSSKKKEELGKREGGDGYHEYMKMLCDACRIVTRSSRTTFPELKGSRLGRGAAVR